MDLKEIEERIIKFWRNFKIFEKSLIQNSKGKRFVWFEGPPFANAVPHMGHFLTRIYKDAIFRFFSMSGFYVPRKAGWDTHGLPIEVVAEKELNFKSKKEIYDYGIDKFNKKCKDLVFTYKNVWEDIDERIGFWIDHKNAYITYDPFYMESCWWIIKKIFEKKLLVRKYKVAPYCPRCETVLAQAELGMPDAYKKVKDPSIFVMFKIIDHQIDLDTYRRKSSKNIKIKVDNNTQVNQRNNNLQDAQEYFLVWTTTPWTLPANLALAVNPNFDYYLYDINGLRIWTHQNFINNNENGSVKLLKTIKGKNLVGLKYEPLFKINFSSNKNDYKVYPAEFVKEDEGTGIVHIAPAYGEDDFELSKKYKLSLINYLNEKGEFKSGIINDIDLVGLFFKDADKKIISNLKERNLIFKEEIYEHDYPHCWRCKVPLIYYATQFWVIEVSKIKNKIINNFKQVNWIPKSIGNRFYEWIKEGKDWNLSRTRMWGIPLPVWECNKCGNQKVIGSLQELSSYFKANNNYFLMRHAESLSIKKNFLSSYPEINFNPLTRKGVLDVFNKIPKLKKEKIDIIYASPLLRTKEAALLISEKLKIPVFFDERLREMDLGVLNHKPYEEFDKYIINHLTGKRDLNKKIENGESLNDVKKRAILFLLDLEKKHRNKNILIISHGAVLWMLESEMQALSSSEIENFKVKSYKIGEIRKVNLKIVPRDETGEINLHRPYVDDFVWRCKCGGWYKRVVEIADIWFDSGCVPFASYHYPFENLKEIDKEIVFPADFIIEGIDQTRGWFYTLLVISTLIKGRAPYKNVLANGFVLDKEGKKMSKSWGNFVTPEEIIKKYGAEVGRFYLFYLNEIGDNKRFDEDEIVQIKREFFDLLYNVVKFYKFYYEKKTNFKGTLQRKSIDLWFMARIKESYAQYYQSMTNFNVHKSSRILFNLLGDFSRWWLRRSRKRFQNPTSKEELFCALINFEDFLYQFLKMLAPICPFVSEYFYHEIRDEIRNRYPVKESIHLERLPKVQSLSLKEKLLLKEVEKIREIASEVHSQRKQQGIKVRQPLSSLSLNVKYSQEVLEMLKDEVNVLEIKIDPSQKEPIVVDFSITPELKKIGIYKDLVRFVQDLRQEIGLTPKDQVFLNIQSPLLIKEIIEDNLDLLEKETRSKFIKKEKISKKYSLLGEKEFNYENFGKIKIFLFK